MRVGRSEKAELPARESWCESVGALIIASERSFGRANSWTRASSRLLSGWAPETAHELPHPERARSAVETPFNQPSRRRPEGKAHQHEPDQLARPPRGREFSQFGAASAAQAEAQQGEGACRRLTELGGDELVSQEGERSVERIAGRECHAAPYCDLPEIGELVPALRHISADPRFGKALQRPQVVAVDAILAERLGNNLWALQRFSEARIRAYVTQRR